MGGKCIVNSCRKAASKCCGSCGFVQYCSTECQKEDWKKRHKKKECVNMKKLASVNLTEEEIRDVAGRILCISDRYVDIGEPFSSIDMNMECLNFVRDRLGRLNCNDSRSSTGDGLWLNHFVICRLLVSLGVAYFDFAGSSENDSHSISYLSEAREMLVQAKDAGINEPEIWRLFLICDRSIHQSYARSGQAEQAKYHCVEWVATARQCNDTDQVDYLITALRMLSYCIRRESNLPEALAVAEESYTIASKHFSPAHRKVVRAAGPLIDCLIAMEDFSTADTYCRMNYANMIDPKNAGDYSLGEGNDIMHQLVNIWLQKEPGDDEIVEKALAYEAIDLGKKVFAYATKNGKMRYRISILFMLCRVFLKGNVLTEESEGFLHQLITMCIAEDTMDGVYIHDSLVHLRDFYLNIRKSLQMGSKTTLIQRNIELMGKKLLELKYCSDGSIDYVKGSQKIKPYFKNNAELNIEFTRIYKWDLDWD